MIIEEIQDGMQEDAQGQDEIVNEEVETHESDENSEEVLESAAVEASEEQTEEEQGESEEIEITIGEESLTHEEEPKEAPNWVKNLRKKNREDQKRLKEMERQLEEYRSAENKPVELGTMPKLEEYDYDEDKFALALTQFHDRKREVEMQQTKQQQEQAQAQKEWQAKLDTYEQSKNELKVKDFDVAEETILSSFSENQQGIIVQGAENSALLVYAIGKNPQRAEELAKITDPVKFTFAVAKLEKDLKVKKRKAPPPERKIKGSAPSTASDTTLEKLRAEAEKTGNFTKVLEYKRSKRA